MNANDIKIRCSSLGYIMGKAGGLTEKQSEELAALDAKQHPQQLTAKQQQRRTELIAKRDTFELPETAKTHLIDLYTRHKYDRFEEVQSRFLEKGNKTEEDSITIVSRKTKTLFKKNETHLSNDFIQGTPDLFKGESIYKAEIVRDTKSSWSIFTFNRSIFKPLIALYECQVKGYMALTGAKEGYIDYCLNNTPYHLVMAEWRKESYGYPDGVAPNWIELQILANHVYDKKTFDQYIEMRGIGLHDDNCKAIYMGFVDVPLEERHFSFKVERDESEIQAIYDQVKACREWMNENLFKENN